MHGSNTLRKQDYLAIANYCCAGVFSGSDHRKHDVLVGRQDYNRSVLLPGVCMVCSMEQVEHAARGNSVMWKSVFAILILVTAASATAATGNAVQILTTVAAGKTVEMSPDSTIVLGGAADTLTTQCGIAGLTVEERLQLTTFIRTAATRMAVGDRYADPSLGKAVGSQMSGGQYYAAAGVAAKRSIPCGTSSTRFLKTVVRSITESRASGAKGQFVASCSRSSLSAQQCSCLLETASTIYPNLASSTYDRSIISSVMQANPIIGFQLIARCGIGDY